MNLRQVRGLAWGACAVCLAFNGAGVVLRTLSASTADVGQTLYPGALAIALLFPIVGALIASRQPRNPIGWLFVLMGLSEAVVALSAAYAVYALLTRAGTLPGGDISAWIADWVWLPGFALVSLLLLLFPTGRPLSARWRWLGWACLSGTLLDTLQLAVVRWPYRGLASILHPSTTGELWPGFDSPLALAGDVASVLIMVGLVGAISSVIVRLWGARGVERQQLKWFSYAAVLATLDLIASIILNPNGGNLRGDAFDLTLTGLQAIFFAGIPIAVGIAILKYRLYDIDLIIRRTLIYGVLTAWLAIVYFGSVIILQQIVHALTGTQQSELITVISTLLIAASFVPLRQRVQSAIDRRFYRRKYDAAKTLEAFSIAVRDEVDLAELREHLLAVVDETMQPAHVSLWLKRGNGSRH